MSEKSEPMGSGFEVEHGTTKQRVYRDGVARGDSSVSLTVIEALAEAQGVSPTDIDTPLYETVDPEALETLFEPTDDSATGRVVFEIEGFEVTVTASHDVFVRTIE